MILAPHTSLALALALVPSLAWAGSDAITSQREPTAIYGGELAAACQWPTTVGLYGAQSQCTGALVHPEIVVTAAHCLEGGALTTVTLGEDIYAPRYELDIAQCTKHPNYELEYPDYADFMFCRLSSPLLGVPTVPIIMGCEADELESGAPAVLAGYGLADDGGPEGRKRFVTTQIDRLQDSRVFFVGGTGNGTCNGDSGGPAFFQVHDGSWRVIGTTTGGENCGDWGQSELVHLFVPWIESETGLDLSPCTDEGGNWTAGPECGAFAAEPDLSHGSWDGLCGGAPITGANETCAPPGSDDSGGGSSGGDDSGDAGGDGSDDGSGVSEGGDSSDDGGDDDDDDGLDPWPDVTGASPANDERPEVGCACSSDGHPRGRGAFVLWAAALAPFVRRRRRP